MRKTSFINALIVLLLLLGIGVLGYPTVCDMYYKWAASREISQYNQVAEAEEKDYSELWAAAEEYNRQLAEDARFSASALTDHAEYVARFLNPLGTGMMGHIEIPSIHVRLPVYQGTEESVLQAGAGHWLGTSLPTGGESTHCVITAHNGLVKAKLFTDLDKVKEGDRFSLSILDRVLTYEVDQIRITDPDDFEPLEIIEGEDLVTLYTCYPYGINSHRLLVRGHRVENAGNATDTNKIVTNANDGNMLVLIFTVFLCAAALSLTPAVYEKFRYKGRYEKMRKGKEK